MEIEEESKRKEITISYTFYYKNGEIQTLMQTFSIFNTIPLLKYKITNREWLNTLDDRTFVTEIKERIKDSYAFLQWLQDEYKGEHKNENNRNF